MARIILAALCCSTVLGAPQGFAQNPQPAPPGTTNVPLAPPNAPSPPPEKMAPPDKDAKAGSSTLSDKLAQQHGTLHPPTSVDPAMTVNPPAQAQSTMPVIPPPGTPGGNQHVVPK